MSFNKRLMHSRMKAGLTQAGLAEKIGVTRAAVNYWENSEDDTRYPTPHNLNKCAEALNVDPSWLRFGDTKEIIKQNIVALPEKQSIIPSIPILQLNEVGRWLRSTTQGKGKMQAQKTEGNSICNIKLDTDNMIDINHPINSLYPGTILTFESDFDRNDIKTGSIVLVQFGMTDNFKVRQYQKDGTDEILKTFNHEIPHTPVNDNIKIVGICIYQGRSML